MIVCRLDDYVGKYKVEGSRNTMDCTKKAGDLLSCINGFRRIFVFPYDSSTGKINNSEKSKFGTCDNSVVNWEFTEKYNKTKNGAWIKSGLKFDCMIKIILQNLRRCTNET